MNIPLIKKCASFLARPTNTLVCGDTAEVEKNRVCGDLTTAAAVALSSLLAARRRVAPTFMVNEGADFDFGEGWLEQGDSPGILLNVSVPRARDGETPDSSDEKILEIGLAAQLEIFLRDVNKWVIAPLAEIEQVEL